MKLQSLFRLYILKNVIKRGGNMWGISTWVLSIAGICFISVIADLVIPEGKTNSHVKNVISYTIILVVIMPLPKLLNSSLSVDDIFSELEINIQDEKHEIYGAVVSISANIFETDMQIDAVYVDLYNVVISDKLQNINIKTEVVSVVLNIIDIAKEKVIIYE